MSTSAEPADDLDLAERFLEGEPRAVAQVTGWIRYAVSPFRRRLGEAELDDATQDVLVRLTEALRGGAFRGDASFETYVRRATAHRCIDGYRRGRRWQTVEIDEVEGWTPKATVPSAFDRASDRQRLASFARVLAQLPEHCRELWRRVLAGASYQAIGREVGVRPGTLRVRLLRCRRQAEELLEAATRGPDTPGEASAGT